VRPGVCKNQGFVHVLGPSLRVEQLLQVVGVCHAMHTQI
jgi:hypothetical protein